VSVALRASSKEGLSFTKTGPAPSGTVARVWSSEGRPSPTPCRVCHLLSFSHFRQKYANNRGTEQTSKRASRGAPPAAPSESSAMPAAKSERGPSLAGARDVVVSSASSRRHRKQNAIAAHRLRA
jgi:hypothetical protein